MPNAAPTLFDRNCKACHQIGPEAINRVGPRLNGVFGRKFGALEDFKYSRIHDPDGQ
jgi:cytochrome c